MFRHGIAFLAIALAISLGRVHSPAFASEQERAIRIEPASGVNRPGTTWALLIGVNDYRHVSRLGFCAADVELLAKTLVERGGLVRDRHVLRMTDDAPAGLRPRRDNIRRQLTTFLAKVGPNDTALVFFSGHGFRGVDAASYLAPVDFDPASPETTGVSLAEVRRALEAAPGAAKLLWIDACHAGNLRDGHPERLTHVDLESEFKNAVGVDTIASCRADEKSHEWRDKRQGLFTYWLCQGLAGAADRDGDMIVSSPELYEYVHDLVREMSPVVGSQQTPVRILGDVVGAPVVVRLVPEPTTVGLKRIAGQLHEQIMRRRLHLVGIASFSSLIDGRRQLGAQLGAFGVTGAELLGKELNILAEGRYRVLLPDLVDAMLGDADANNAGHPAIHQDLAEQVDAVLLGSIQRVRQSGPDRLYFSARLTRRADGTLLANSSAVLQTDDGVWGLLGDSANLVGVDISLPSPQPDARTDRTPPWMQTVSYLNDRANERHPLLDPVFPFVIEIRDADGRRAKPLIQPDRKRPNQLVVSAREGETFTIWCTNHYHRRVYLRLLVDGINIRIQEASDTDLQHVTLDKAAGWVVLPGEDQLFKGWYKSLGPRADVDAFQFVSAPQSVAARLNYGEKIGLITAAFYEAELPADGQQRDGFEDVGGGGGGFSNQPRDHFDGRRLRPRGAQPRGNAPRGLPRGAVPTGIPDTPELGVGEGARRSTQLQARRPYVPGRLLAIVNIRYVHEDALRE